MWKLNCVLFLAILVTAPAVNSEEWSSFEPAELYGEEFNPRAVCSVDISSLSEDAPAIVALPGEVLLTPNGTTGFLDLAAGAQIKLLCMGNELRPAYNDERPETATLMCNESSKFTSLDWFEGSDDLTHITCSCPSRANIAEQATACFTGVTQIFIGVQGVGKQYRTYISCFRKANGRVEYTTYPQTAVNLLAQELTTPPTFQQGPYFPGMRMQNLYLLETQLDNFIAILGPTMGALHLKDDFLVPGQLAASADFTLVTAQRTTFNYVNTAPQWKGLNEGNWDVLEKSIRVRIGELTAVTTIYSGTWGNLELEDDTGEKKVVYLNAAALQVPVPLYFYKVVYETVTKKATAFVSINNPHVTLEEAKALTFCMDFCQGSNAFKWLEWEQDDVSKGYSFCCQVDDFQKTVTHLPVLANTGLFA